MPILLLIGDIHVRADNLNAVEALEQWLTTHTAKQAVTHIVLLGDILDRHSHVEQPLLARADRLIRHCLSLACRPHLIILCGNHDYTSNQVFLTPDHWLVVYNGFAPGRLTVVDTPTELESLPGMLMLPYVPDGRFVEALNRHRADASWVTRYRLILCHQSFTNIKGVGHFLTEADTWLPEWPLTISGHIHDSHWASDNLLYAGSYIPVSHGESNAKYLWLVNDSTGTNHPLTRAQLTSIPVNFLSRTTVESSPHQLLDKLNAQAIVNPNQHTRVVVSGTHAEISAWTKGPEAARLRSQKQVKVVVKVIAESKTPEVPEGEGTVAPTSFRENLGASIQASTPAVQAAWARFQASHVNLFV